MKKSNDFEYFYSSKVAFTHPVFACVFWIVLHFDSTDDGSYMSMKTNVSASKMQRSAENATLNWMWQLGFKFVKRILNFFNLRKDGDVMC